MTPEPATQKTAARTTAGQARFAFTILLIINILNYADRYILPAILPKVKHDLGLSGTEAGLIGSSFLLVYAFATLPLGIWADRGVRKNIVALCVGIWSVATTLAGITRNFGQLFAVRAVLGIGEAGYAPGSVSLLGDLFPKAKRGRILSYWSSGTLIGTALGFAIGGGIEDTVLGWRWAFFVVGIPSLIAAFLAWRMVEPVRGAFDRRDEEAQEAVKEAEEGVGHGSLDKNFWRSAQKLFKVPTYLVLVGAFVFSFFTIGGTSFWLPTYFVDTFGLSLTQAGLITAGVLLGSGLIGTIAGGWLADFAQRRRPEGRLLVATLGFLIGAPLVLIALTMHSLPFFIVMFIVAGISLNFCTGPLNAVIQDVVAPHLRATAVGLSLLLAHLLGDAAAPLIIGNLQDRFTLGPALLATAPTFLFLAGLVCLIGLRTVRRDMKRMQEQL